MNNEITVKEITWETNYNNKMECKSFPHIDIIPDQLEPRSIVESRIIKINTKDGSHQPVQKRIYDILILPLKEVPDIFAMMSHNMTRVQLIKHFLSVYGSLINEEKKIGIYYYEDVHYGDTTLH
jgi:hypothetical protein